MPIFEKSFIWDNSAAAIVQFNIDLVNGKPEAVNIFISTNNPDIDIPQQPTIIQNKDGERIFRADCKNKEEGHTFEYFDNKYSKDIISQIDKMLSTHFLPEYL